GHRIPAWYNETGAYVVCKTMEEAQKLFAEKGLSYANITQDEDVLDTWASSWLWPISVFNGFKENQSKDIAYYYPTDVLVTAPEILFFWVARMIIAGYYYRHEKPFKHVYLTGIVRDKQRRKMSKSLGNSPDPLDLITQYGADGVRMGMLLMAPAGNDILFDEKQVEQGRNFSNKLWNVFRLISGWEIKNEHNSANTPAIEWFASKLSETIKTVDVHFENYRVSDALMLLYSFVWDDFCSWYLEFIKPAFGEPIDADTYNQTITFFEDILKLLHPFMPFITEELYHALKERSEGDDIIVAAYPEAKECPGTAEAGEFAKTLISGVRDARSKNQLSPKEALPLYCHTISPVWEQFIPLVKKVANLQAIQTVTDTPENAITFIAGKEKFYIAINKALDAAQERKKLDEQLQYHIGFLRSVEAKLMNEKFIQNAPQSVIDAENRKKQDALDKIRMLENALARLG
ncbi:MAG: class I tRNA ligase family protein, partial [Chitinophagales bacterium]